MTPALRCEALSVRYRDGSTPIRNVSFDVAPGECFALVGGSGAGKSTIARALLGLHGRGTKLSGSLSIAGRDMTSAGPAEWRHMRGRDIGFVAQNPWDSCDPLRPVGDHVAEAWRCHGLSVSWQSVAARLSALDIPDAATRLHRHPHTWSGGMLQRGAIAAASALAPPVLIADEPTSALDADRAQNVLDRLHDLGTALLLVSHDIELVLRNADRVGVLHAGELVEIARPAQLRNQPRHAETRRLLGALKPFAKRPPRPQPAPLLRLQEVGTDYDHGRVTALRSVSLELAEAEILGVQGPSGCGKSTLLRLVMGLEQPSRGSLWRADALTRPGAILPVFQDPVGSLVPHWPVWKSVSEPLTARGRPRVSAAERMQQATRALHMVGLGGIDPQARPAELSLGQCQRIAIARATLTRPALIVADEPTSALDSVSIQQVGSLLRAASEQGSAVLLVSHDRGFLERLADRTITLT